MVQKTINVEAKIGLESSAMVWDTDSYYPKDYRFSNNTASKVQIQKIITKDLYSKEPKVKDPKSALIRIDTTKLLEKDKKDQKDKKRKF